MFYLSIHLFVSYFDLIIINRGRKIDGELWCKTYFEDESMVITIINRLQKIAARRDIRSSTGPEVGDRKLLLRRFGQEQVPDGDMGEVGDGLDLGESGPLLLGQPSVSVREPAAYVIIIAASTTLCPLQYAGSYDGAHADPLRGAS